MDLYSIRLNDKKESCYSFRFYFSNVPESCSFSCFWVEKSGLTSESRKMLDNLSVGEVIDFRYIVKQKQLYKHAYIVAVNHQVIKYSNFFEQMFDWRKNCYISSKNVVLRQKCESYDSYRLYISGSTECFWIKRENLSPETVTIINNLVKGTTFSFTYYVQYSDAYSMNYILSLNGQPIRYQSLLDQIKSLFPQPKEHQD